MLPNAVLVDTPSLVLSFDQTRQCLCAEWKGHHDTTSIIAGCSLVRQTLTKQPCEKILDDRREITSSWDDIASWVGQEFFRILAAKGVRYFAWICPMELAGRQSIKLAMHYARHMQIELFDDVASGHAWLQQQA